MKGFVESTSRSLQTGSDFVGAGLRPAPTTAQTHGAKISAACAQLPLANRRLWRALDRRERIRGCRARCRTESCRHRLSRRQSAAVCPATSKKENSGIPGPLRITALDADELPA